MSNIVLPDPGPKESISDYIQRLLSTKIINPNQVQLAIQKFNKK